MTTSKRQRHPPVEAVLEEMVVIRRGEGGTIIAIVPFSRKDIAEVVVAHTKNEGELFMDGEPIAFPKIRKAQRHGPF